MCHIRNKAEQQRGARIGSKGKKSPIFVPFTGSPADFISAQQLFTFIFKSRAARKGLLAGVQLRNFRTVQSLEGGKAR